MIYITDQILYILQDFDFYYNSVVLLSSADDQWNDKAEGSDLAVNFFTIIYT